MELKQQTSRYGGTTKRKWKRIRKSSTSGTEKGGTCVATSLDKAMTKYPRACKTHPDLYISVLKKKDLKAKHKTYFTENY